jgi:hypothetical protein
MKNENFEFWNCLTLSSKSKENNEISIYNYNSILEDNINKNPPKCFNNFLKDNLNNLFDSIIKSSPKLIILDNITPLFYIFDNKFEIFEFIQKLKVYSIENNATVIIQMNENEDKDEKKLLNYMKFISNIIFSINNLKSGYSKDVHGEVKILFNLDNINI